MISRELLLARRLGVDPVQLPQVDLVDVEAAQRHEDALAQVLRPAQRRPHVRAVPGETALGRDDDVAVVLPADLPVQRLVDQVLRDVRPVRVGRVDQRHARARPPGAAPRSASSWSFGGPQIPVPGDPHRPEPQPVDRLAPELDRPRVRHCHLRLLLLVSLTVRLEPRTPPPGLTASADARSGAVERGRTEVQPRRHARRDARGGWVRRRRRRAWMGLAGARALRGTRARAHEPRRPGGWLRGAAVPGPPAGPEPASAYGDAMRIYVLGATGHIGTYLVPRLVRAGHEVVAASRGTREPYHPDDGLAARRSGSCWTATRPTRTARRRPGSSTSGRTRSSTSSASPPRRPTQLVEGLRGQVGLHAHCGSIWSHGLSTSLPMLEDDPKLPFGEYGVGQARHRAAAASPRRRSGGLASTVVHPGHISGPGLAGDQPGRQRRPAGLVDHRPRRGARRPRRRVRDDAPRPRRRRGAGLRAGAGRARGVGRASRSTRSARGR